MIRFENSEMFYGLLVIPILVILFYLMLRWRRRSLNKFGELNLVSRLITNYSPTRPVTKFILLTIAYVFLIIALANPQVGSKLVEAERKGIDIMIALDVSNSMLAEDIQPDRLARAKQAIAKLVDRLSNDRIGIIVFAGKAYTQLPITTDYSAAKMFLSTINTNIVPMQGTAIGEAIKMASGAFEDETHSRAIIVITDGENHEDDAVKEATEAAAKGIKVFTIGMGLPDGTPIPVYDKLNRKIGYKKDRQGNTVVTKLNETMLQQIASAGQGTYVRANNTTAGL
ncbi:MAG: VWA domain-containing protein, partial [Bacteroidales bacterium]|nr:VWA domain-containing protein [Bacteroidales bacterium]